MDQRRDDSWAPKTVPLRDLRPGDLGWVVQMHGEFYSQEYGWTMKFEGIVAEAVGRFAQRHDPVRERGWIAKLDGERVVSIFLITHPDDPTIAKLRMLFVSPDARGGGVGSRLVDECVAFARRARYHG